METAAKDEGRVIEMPTESFTRKDERALPAIQTATPMSMLAVAIQKGMDPATLRDLIALQREWEANEARKAFVAALSAFKAAPPVLFKNKSVSYENKSGGKTEYDHATLDQVANEIGKKLSPHGLSFRWNTEQKEGGMIRVTCILMHDKGHSESIWLESGRDDSGGKNNIQALGSTVTYLERYTLLALTGMAVKDQDDDGGETGNRGDKKEEKKPEGPPPYAADAFTKNLPAWTKLIKSGKKTAAQIITMVSSKAVLSDEQKKQIEAASITFAEIAEQLEAADKAKDKKALVAAATLIERIADDQQRADLEKLYESFGGEWE